MKYIATIFAALSAAFLIAGCGEKKSHKYTVEMKNGVPFLATGGVPERNRMFYSNVPGTKYRSAETTEKTHAIEFESPADTQNAVLALNFGAVIKDIWISEMSLEEIGSGTVKTLYNFNAQGADPALGVNWSVKALEAWRDYYLMIRDAPPDPKYAKPYAAKNENGVLHIEKECIDPKKFRGRISDLENLNFTIKNIALKKGAKYRLKISLRASAKGRFEALLYDARTLEVFATNTGETFMSQEKFAAERGVNFITFGVPAFWKDDETCKKLVDSRFKPVIEANPNVKIIVRLGLEPDDDWLDAHPDEIMRNKDGSAIERNHVRFPFPASEAYRRDAMEAMRKLIKYVEEKYPNNIAGYHPSGGNSSEWFYGATFVPNFNGNSPAALKAWRKWLSAKYKTDEALQKAWRNPGAKIAEVGVPSEAERRNVQAPLIDPETAAHVVDFNYFLQDSMCDTILLAAKTIRQTAPKGRLSVVFYGYGNVFASTTKGPAYSGHYALKKALASPDIDVFTSPIRYTERQFGGIKTTQAPTETAALHGKLWLDEDDNRTWLAPESGSPPYGLDLLQTNREISKKVLRRNMAQEALKNVGSWWMDLFGCGWYLDRDLWGVMDEFKGVEEDFIKNPTLFKPGAAITYDEASMCHVAGAPWQGRIAVMSLLDAAEKIGVSGTTLGYYLFDDIIEGKVAPKIHYVSAAFALDKKRRALLRKTENKTTNVYLWNAGYIDLDERKFSLEAAKDATGFDLEIAGTDNPTAYPTEDGKKAGLNNAPIGANPHIKAQKHHNALPQKAAKTTLAPLFSPKPGKGDVVLAEYDNGKPAIVVRNPEGKRPQIFCGVPQISENLASVFADIAGAHKYVDNRAVATANGNYVAFHTTRDGKHTLTLKKEAEVYDVLEKKNLGRFKTKTFDLKMGDVKLFRLK